MKEKIRSSKFVYPNLKIPSYEEFIDPSSITAIGKTKRLTVSGLKNFIFGIKRQDRIYPLYIIGKKGVGKSKLLESVIRQDIFFNYGFCHFDFSSNNFYNFLNFIPKNKVENVCLIDLDRSDSFVFNPFEGIKDNFKLIFIEDLIILFKNFLKDFWDYHYELLFYNALSSLMLYPQARFIDIFLFLKDESFRNKVLNCVKDKNIINYWRQDFENFLKKHNFFYLISKLNYLFINPNFYNIFNYKENKIDFFQLIQENKFIFINLNKAKFSEELINFISSLFLLKIKEAGFYRSYLSKEKKFLFYLYLENFYNFNENLVIDLLHNFSDYGFSLNLSHQYLFQISDKLRNLIFSNCGHLIVFNINGDDALKIKNEFGGLIDLKDFISLNLKEFYVRITVDKEVQDPFFAESLKIFPDPKFYYKNFIINKSKKKYGL